MRKQPFILFLLLFHIQAISQINPCTLTGGNIYIDNNSSPWMINATVNGMSNYSYSWNDTNGVIISTANQIPFYTQWCVTITDNINKLSGGYLKSKINSSLFELIKDLTYSL